MTELEFYVSGGTQDALELAAAKTIHAFLSESDLWEVGSLASWAEPEITTMDGSICMYRARYVARLRPKLKVEAS